MSKTCFAALFLSVSCVAAETPRLDRTFGDGRLAVTVSGETGFPVAYAVDGRTVVTATDARQPFAIKENWYAVTNDGTWRVESVSFETNVLRTVTRAGRWLVGQELTLFPEVRRVRRVFTLEWTADAPAKLRGFDVDGGTMRLGAAGGYRLPCVLPVVDVASEALRPGVSHETYESPFSVLAVDGAGHGVSWVVDDARPYCDTGFTRVAERSGAIAVTSPFDCAGYVRRGSRETVGDLWMCFGRQDSVEAALRDLPKWFEQVGQRVVEGRPEWIRQGVVYSMHPCGTRVSQWRDWGGFPFSTTQVKRIAELGANTIWLLPIESASPYFPFDYHRLADNVGTAGDYRAFVAETKRNGLRLFRDIVPHGGTDTCPRAKAHPEWLLRDERGGTAGSAVGFEPDSRYWVFDMGNPEWCAYMSDVAKAYLADGLDGLRIDACGGSPRPNWDAGLRGRRASLSRRAAGLRMQAAIREGARKSNPEAVMLAEGDLSAFATTSDVLYDWSLAFRGLRAFATADAATVVDGVRRYLNDEVYSQVPGHLRLRYQSNHDCLHSELVYGGAAHLANYALLAWMPGVAFVYQEEELGHSDALREIYRVRREIPELTLGTAEYAAVGASPGVYAARFTGNGFTSVVRINYNGVETDGLQPFEYRVERNGRLAFSSAADARKGLPAVTGGEGREPEMRDDRALWRFPKAKRWCVLAADGRYEEKFFVRHPFYDRARPLKPWTYHREQGNDCQFDTRLHPFGFSPDCATVAVETGAGEVWRATFDSTAAVRLLEDRERPDELTVEATGLRGATPFVRSSWPPKCAPSTGDPRLTAWPAAWRFEEGNLRVDLSRGGAIRGVWRRQANGEWAKSCGVGTPKSTAGFGVKQFDALWECEAQVRFERRGSGLRLVFEGELRDRSRFGQPTSALPYAVAYAFDGDGSFAVTPSAAITDCVGRNGGLLFFELERGESCAPVPKRSVSGFFGRKAKVVSDDALLFKAMWLDREVTALRAHEPSGFTLKLDFVRLADTSEL